MLKYFKWFKRNSGKTRKSYNSETGHTRNTQSRKTTKAQTISRSNNSNGTIRETKTWRRPDGLWKRTVKTIGSKPSPVRKPKFIKPKATTTTLRPVKRASPVKMVKSRPSKADSWLFSADLGSSSDVDYDPTEAKLKHKERVERIVSYFITVDTSSSLFTRMLHSTLAWFVGMIVTFVDVILSLCLIALSWIVIVSLKLLFIVGLIYLLILFINS